MGMLCNRRGGCFAKGCFQWGCPGGNGTNGCCGGGSGSSPANFFQLMSDPCHQKRVRASMQLVYGAYNGGCVPRRGFCAPPPSSFPPACPQPAQEPIRILFKCPTYCTPLPEPVINC